MELEKSILFKINDLNCEFRSINVSDISQDYIDGLKDQNKYIENIPAEVSFSSQKNYVEETLISEGDTICGLFLDSVLVGTAGVQLSLLKSFLKNINTPVDTLATVGIFVFNKSYRGMGLGKTLVWAAMYLFHNSTQTEWFGAGMAKENTPSLKSFMSCGFRQVYEDEENYKVLLNYSEITKPEFIKDEAIKVVNQIAG